MKKKQCTWCKKTTDRLWYSNPPTCMDGLCRKKAQEQRSSKSGTKTPEKKKVSWGNGIKPVADKRAQELALYRPKRDKFLKENPVCQYPGCFSTKVTCHHMKGRSGKMVYNEKYFAALCWPHHHLVEGSPEESKKIGLSANRLDKEL